MKQARRTLLRLGAYAAAMAWVEAAVVVYLRRLYYPEDPLAIFPMRIWPMRDLLVELAREAATIVMILAVGLLAVQGRVRRTAAFLFVFGVWDLCYYLWLKVALGWPAAWTEWDILFLVPWPWLAPWLAPAAAALLFVLWAAPVLRRQEETAVPRRAWALASAGLCLMLASFLLPALPLLGNPAALAAYVPGRFPWWIYLPGAALLAAGLFAGRAGAGDHGGSSDEADACVPGPLRNTAYTRLQNRQRLCIFNVDTEGERRENEDLNVGEQPGGPHPESFCR